MSMVARINAGERSLVNKVIEGSFEKLSLALPDDLQGDSIELILNNQGQDTYYTMDLSWAETKPPASAEFHGLEISRTYSIHRNGEWISLSGTEAVSIGEVVKVELLLDSPAGVPFVAVTDHLPGGLVPLDEALTAPVLVRELQRGSEHNYWLGFSHWRFADGTVNAYTKFLPPGNHRLVYFARPAAAGEYIAFPPHAEAMYDATVYGTGTVDRVRIRRESRP